MDDVWVEPLTNVAACNVLTDVNTYMFFSNDSDKRNCFLNLSRDTKKKSRGTFPLSREIATTCFFDISKVTQHSSELGAIS